MIISLVNILKSTKMNAREDIKKMKKSSTCHCFILKEHYTSLKMYEACIDTEIRSDQMKIDAKDGSIHAFAHRAANILVALP